jgi:hypothetical protein
MNAAGGIAVINHSRSSFLVVSAERDETCVVAEIRPVQRIFDGVTGDAGTSG